MRAFALALSIAAHPVFATQPDWPALYDVTAVASGDVLNVRQRPSADAAIIGSLLPTATDIEVIRTNPSEDWAQINVGERSGWVSLRFMTRQPDQWMGRLPPVTFCFGTEPIWSLERADGLLRFERLDFDPIGVDETYFLISRNSLENFVASGSSITSGLTLHVAAQECSDGMSDRAYGLTADLLVEDAFDATLYSGCCTISPG